MKRPRPPFSPFCYARRRRSREKPQIAIVTDDCGRRCLRRRRDGAEDIHRLPLGHKRKRWRRHRSLFLSLAHGDGRTSQSNINKTDSSDARSEHAPIAIYLLNVTDEVRTATDEASIGREAVRLELFSLVCTWNRCGIGDEGVARRGEETRLCASSHPVHVYIVYISSRRPCPDLAPFLARRKRMEHRLSHERRALDIKARLLASDRH